MADPKEDQQLVEHVFLDEIVTESALARERPRIFHLWQKIESDGRRYRLECTPKCWPKGRCIAKEHIFVIIEIGEPSKEVRDDRENSTKSMKISLSR